jgi:hypothetical protein
VVAKSARRPASGAVRMVRHLLLRAQTFDQHLVLVDTVSCH